MGGHRSSGAAEGNVRRNAASEGVEFEADVAALRESVLSRSGVDSPDPDPESGNGPSCGGLPLDGRAAADDEVHRLESLDVGVPGLVELLGAAELGSYESACQQWCAEMGAVDLDELRESVAGVEVAVGFPLLERLRF